MFGFLKKKLKDAVKKFSSSAEQEVEEKKVEDKQEVAKAKQEEKKIVEKAKKATKKPAEVAKKKEKPVAKEAKKKTAAKKPPKVEKEVTVTPEEHVEKTPAKEEVPEATVEEKKDVVVEEKVETPKKPVAELPDEEPVEEKAKEVEEAPKEEPTVEEVVEETPKEEEITETPEEPERKGFFGKLKEKFTHKEEVQAPVAETPAEVEISEDEVEEKTEESVAEEPKEGLVVEESEEIVETPEEKPSLLGKLKDSFTKKTLSEEKFEELFFDLELAMLENNVAVEVIEKIKADLKDELTSGKVNRMGIDAMIASRLRQSVEELFDVETFDLLKRIKQSEKPFKICMIGVNGSGKTTTLAKLVHMLQENGLTCVVAASDTFRAAAIDQLREHMDKLSTKLISQGYNADPAAVAFDAVKHAEANNVDVVLVDTAGRLHSNTNLMQELEKVVRVAKPDLKIFVGESITGNDCVEQAKVFDSLVGVDAIVLSKADVDEKGGAAISVSYVTQKPILYLGTGQTYDDLEQFDKEKVIGAMGL